MNENELINSIINPETDEISCKTYKSVAMKEMNFKKLLLTLVISVTAVMFVICFYIVVFGSNAKEGSFVYDSISYWIIISFIITAYAILLIDSILIAVAYHFLKQSSSTIAAKSVRCVLTNRRICIVNITKKKILASIYLSEVDSIMRYVDDQLKVMTTSGKNYVFKIDDNQDFIDRYPGLLRSEKQRAKRLVKEALDSDNA